MKPRLIFFDIDGTLLSHAGKTHVPESAEEAVRRLKANGHLPAIATARNPVLTRKVAAFFGIDLLVCCNGAHVAHGPTLLCSEWLGAGFTRFFRTQIPSLCPHAYAFDAESIFAENSSDYPVDFIVDQAGFDCRKPISTLERIHLAYVFTPLSPSRKKSCEPDADAFATPHYVEFRPKGVSKWSGILKAAADLGFGTSDIVAVGDGLNDIEMVRDSALGIAVGGAAPELKSVADYVAEDIDEKGIFKAFKTLNMI